jgi:hypothetical protein
VYTRSLPPESPIVVTSIVVISIRFHRHAVCDNENSNSNGRASYSTQTTYNSPYTKWKFWAFLPLKTGTQILVRASLPWL